MRILPPRLWVRLAFVLVVAAAVPLLGAGLLTVGLVEGWVRRDASDRHRALSRLGATLVHDYLAESRGKLTTVGRLLARELAAPSVGEYGESNLAYRDTVVQRLSGLVEPPDVYLELDYYASGENPRFVGQASQMAYAEQQQRPAALDPIVSTPLVQEPLRTDRPFVSPAPEERGGFPVLLVSAPVAAGDVRFGVLVAHVDFRRVQEILSTLAQDRYRVRLVDLRGAALSEAGAAVSASIGEAHPVGFADWSVEVEEAEAKVLAPLTDVERRIAAWLGLGVLLSIALGGLAANRIARPLAVLTRTAGRMESGDLAARARLTGEDEIGRLGAAFDRMAEAIERLDVARSDFVSGVSHELRTPLTSIRLSIANLLDGVVGELDPRARTVLDRLDGDVRRLIEMTNALLELARLESGATEPAREAVDLGELARQAVGAIEPLAVAKRLTISVAGAGSARVDRALALRVASILLDNAVKFTPEGGRVEVVLGEGTLRVSDTGPGVDPEGLFEKFRQGTHDGVKNTGFGLGLAIAKRIVDLHGGSIGLGPAGRGEGATFVVRW